MKRFLLRTSSLVLVGALLAFSACDDDDVEVFEAPTIAVVSDIAEPYPGDKVTYTISVTAPGKLKEVLLNNTSIKTYSADEMEDSFTYEYTVPENETLGPKSLTFKVTDKQGAMKEGQTVSSLTVLNPDFRGNPVVLYDFQAAAVPNNVVKSIVRDIGGQPWENAYDIFLDATDPESPSNRVLQADRKGAHEWYFQGGGAVKIQFQNPIAEEQIEALVSGERVLQMNMYFKEVPKLITAHKSPENPDATKQDNVNMSWMFSYTNDERVDYPEVWDFVSQDSVAGGIPVIIEMGNFARWDWNNGFFTGKKFYLVGSIQQKNGWQTVTFSRRVGTITAENNAWVYEDFGPGTQASDDPAALQDPQVGLDQIDYMSIILNARLTGFSNQILNPTSPWYEMPGDGNGWASNRIAGLSDDHNTYYIDNIRVIDAAEYDKNPNN